ncbi:MAG TPA: EamA family transporter [Verrucomicrobiae bacterium]|nr:EamA family transporter [Verrucomicrobiae bacterium]
MHGPLVWLTPTLMALLLWGLGQGFVKKWISEVPPARFCLYFVVAKALVNVGYFLTHEHPPPFAPEGIRFLLTGIFAYSLDGLGWILYFESIVAGPITIVGTLSAAYPALTVLFARIFLGEQLNALKYVSVALVIAGCLGLAYSPPDPAAKATKKRWIPFAGAALILWATSQTLVKWSSNFPNANEANMILFNTFGGVLTLGVYGFLKGRKGVHSIREWGKSFLPMGMMAGGDLGVIIALARNGPASLVSPISGAYPLVTLVFAALVLKERITILQVISVAMILAGIVGSSL